MWVCSDHKDENKKCLEDFKNEISNRFKLSFGYIVSIPFISATSFDTHLSPAKKGKNAKKRAKSRVIKDVQTEPNLESGNQPEENSYLSTEEAVCQLKKKLSSQGNKEKLLPITKGRPQFILGYAEGKTRPLLQLYDSGCGGAIFRDGVPEKELGPAVLKMKGPFIVNGVSSR